MSVSYEALVAAILGENNEARAKAEEILEKIKQTDPNGFFAQVLQHLRSSPHLQVREFSAVILRKAVALGSATYDAASPEVKETIKTQLLEMFKTEQNAMMRRKINLVIGSLCAKTDGAKEWPALIPTVFSCWNSDNPDQKASVLNVIERLAEFSIASLRPVLGDVKNILVAGLSHDNPMVAIMGLSAITTLLTELNDQERNSFSDIVPLLFKSLDSAFRAKDDEPIREALQLLENLVKQQPKFLRNHLPPVLGLMAEIASSKDLEGATCRMAMEFLLTLAESGKALVRKMPAFPATVIQLAFHFLLQLEYDPEEWANGTDEDDEEQDNYQTGYTGIHRLAVAFGGKLMLKHAGPIIEEFVKSDDWLRRHAAIVAVGQMTIGCNKELKPQLKSLTELCLRLLRDDPHPRVKWAAVGTIAQFAADYQIEFPKTYGREIFAALVFGMNHPHPRVASHCALCIVDMCHGANDEDVMPYIDGLLAALMRLLQCGNMRIQTSAITAVASLAAVAGEGFIKYYDSFVPGIKQILSQGHNKQLREMRGKAIEAIGVIAKAVGKEKFMPDFMPVMEQLMPMITADLDSDDPQYFALVQALVRICTCVEGAFTPFLPMIIPRLLQSAAIEDACLIQDALTDELPDESEGYHVEMVTLKGVGDRRILINTSLLEEKAAACDVLYQYALVLKDQFFPYVEQTANVLIPLIRFGFHEDVRLCAVNAMPCLLEAAYLHFKKHGPNQQFTRELFTAMLPQLLEGVKIERYLDNVNGFLDAIAECVEVFEEPLPAEQLESITVVLAELVKRCEERRAERENLKNSDDYDEQEAEVIQEDNENEDEFMQYVSQLVTRLAVNGKRAYFPIFHQHLFPIIVPLLAPEKTPGQRESALCIIDDIIEYCEPDANQYIEKFFPLALKYSTDEVPGVRHSAFYGIGVCARIAGSAFAPAVPQCVKAILKQLTLPNFRDEENEPVSDNAISALSKIILAVGDAWPTELNAHPETSLESLLNRWLAYLPVKADSTEGQRVHAMLCTLIGRNHPALMGPNNANLPRIVSVLGRLLHPEHGVAADETELADEETKQKIVAIWGTIRSQLPPAALQDLMNRLDDVAKEGLSTVA